MYPLIYLLEDFIFYCFVQFVSTHLFFRNAQVESDEQWKEAVEGREWDLVTWIERTSIFLTSKMKTQGKELEPQGAHGFWELATNRDYFHLFTDTMLTSIVTGLDSRWAGMSATYRQ